jgi:hypothetical protein
VLLQTKSDFLPGIYPHITKHLVKIGGAHNLGPGNTQHGESFLLKTGGLIGAAEFIGASVCNACGIPVCAPAVVTIDHLDRLLHVFGSRMELGLRVFDQRDVAQWQQVIAMCDNPSIFSAVFAIDLALGNDDRHWKNWLVQDFTDDKGADRCRMRALDFSCSWPVYDPAQHPLKHRSINTWLAAKNWEMFGIAFEQQVFFDTCVKMSTLSAQWLRIHVLNQLRGLFITQPQVDQLCNWWDSCWKQQVIEVIHTTENGVRP